MLKRRAIGSIPFSKAKKVSDLDAEIKTYFQEPLEDQVVNPLQFWLMKKDLSSHYESNG